MGPLFTKNRIQNLIIAALTVSVLLLLAQTQFLTQRSGRLLSTLFPAAAGGQSGGGEGLLSELSAPVRLAATGTYGRYGDLSLTTADESFTTPAALLREALGSAEAARECREADFRAALEWNSVYYDFTAVLPLSVVAGLVSADGAEDVSVRWLLLAEGESGVTLYYTDGSVYRCCATKVAPRSLEAVVNSYQLGNAAFAFELDGADTLAPYSLLQTGDQPALAELQSSNPLDDTDALLSSLGFNPYTNFRYTDSGGTNVVAENERKLWMQTNGVIRYEDSGAECALRLSAEEGQLTAAEAVAGCGRLLSGLTESAGSDATLCLQSIQSTEKGWTLRFDYHSDGVLIRRSDGTPAAEVELSGTGVASFTLCLRRYAATEQTSLLLPLTQALAIARAYPGAEVQICYTDSLTGTAVAQWLAE